MHIYSNDLLLPYPHKNWTKSLPYIAKSLPFEGKDSEYLYTANLQRQPENWYYRTHDVSYTWNSNGYRGGEWTDVNWGLSWIVMGCSHVMGAGIAYEDTLGEQLSRIINAPVVNMGYAGSGTDVIMYNSLRLIDAGIRPKGVIIIAPELTRFTYWREDWPAHMIPNYGNLKHDDVYIQTGYEAYLRYEPNAELHGYMKLRGIQALWTSTGIEPVMAYYRKEKDPTHNIGIHLPPHQDFARDVDVSNGRMHGHFGRATMKSWTLALAQVIQYN
jgi:hypothetical protein